MPRYFEQYVNDAYPYPVVLGGPGAKIVDPPFLSEDLKAATNDEVSSVPDPMNFNAIRFWAKDGTRKDIKIAPGGVRGAKNSIKFTGRWNDAVRGFYLPAGMTMRVFKDRRSKDGTPSGAWRQYDGPTFVWDQFKATGFGISAATAANYIDDWKKRQLDKEADAAQWAADRAAAIATRTASEEELSTAQENFVQATGAGVQAEGEYQEHLTQASILRHQAELDRTSANAAADRAQQLADQMDAQQQAMAANIELQKQQAIAMRQAQAEVDAATGRRAPAAGIPNIVWYAGGAAVALTLGIMLLKK